MRHAGAVARSASLLMVLWVVMYIVSGAVGPIIVDYLGHKGESGDWLSFFPALAAALGLWLVEPLNRTFEKLLRVKTSEESAAPVGSYHGRQLVALAVFDLASTSLVTVGLVHVGSGTYTVIYSSAAAWTAIIGRWRGHRLSRLQWVGVVAVTLGLVLNGAGHAYEDETRADGTKFALSCSALLLGTICHSMVMLLIDEYARESRQRALNLASNLGRVEVLVLATWNAVRGFLGAGAALPLEAYAMFLLLALNGSLHSLAFFSMIGRLGAVGSAILKGFLALVVFGAAAALFCESGHSEQCVSPLKAVSMLFVFFGGLLYGWASKGSPTSLPENMSKV